MARAKGSSKKATKKGKASGKNRSAITGRYVTAQHGRSSPRTTVRESEKAREFSSEFNERYRDTLRDLSER